MSPNKKRNFENIQESTTFLAHTTKRSRDDHKSSSPPLPPSQSSCSNAFKSALPYELRILIFSFLDEEDLGSINQVDKLFCEDSTHHSLSQSRVARVRCGFRGKRSVKDLIQVLLKIRDKRKFHHLKIVGANCISSNPLGFLRNYMGQTQLSHVTSLDLSQLSSWPKLSTSSSLPKALSYLLPNLRRIDLSKIKVRRRTLMYEVSNHCPNLESFTWHHRREEHCCLLGSEFERFKKLKEIHMDDSYFITADGEVARMLFSLDFGCETKPIFTVCKSKLERVSICNNLYEGRYNGRIEKKAMRPIPQEALMKFVRCCPNLKWFRSDLTPENKAILQAENPNIVLVSLK
mmetsp:Transcript_3703/g.5655  ORF Transcript_3703/g.5655 Transcript_3703/m.5655 type:complete len:347 (+) Transcript_3703:142-1182(+)